jgi:hypothetical protein
MPNDTAPAETVDNAEAVSESVPEITSSDDWRSSLPEDIRDNPSFAKFNSVDSLAASYVNLQSHLGRDKIAKPVTEGDWDDVYEFLGRPESAEKYEITLADDLPDAVSAQLDDETLLSFKQQAHKLGLNADQVQSLVTWQAGNMVNQHTLYENSAVKSMEDGEGALRQEWGRAYDQNLELAKKAFNEYGGDELSNKMVSSGMGNDPDVLKAFANIARTTMADKDLAGTTSGSKMAMTPEEAKAEAAVIMGHVAYTDKRHPEHTAIVKKVQDLFNQAYVD